MNMFFPSLLVLTLKKDNSERPFELLTQLDGLAFDYQFIGFKIVGTISNSRKSYAQIKNAFLEKFGMQQEPSNVIKEVKKATLSKQMLGASLKRFDALYCRASFNDKTKFWVSSGGSHKSGASCYVCHVSKYD